MITRFKIFESSNNVEIEFFREVTTKSLSVDLLTIGIPEDEVEIFCQNKIVSYFELSIPYDFQMDIDILLSEYVERGIHSLIVDYDNFPETSAYWLDFGNGLQSIAVGYEGLNTVYYKIYSGDDELTDLLKNDLSDILAANKYNI